MEMFWETLMDEFIEIYSEDDVTQFDVGKLIAYDDEWILIDSFDKNGQYKEKQLMSVSTIFRINYGTKYIKALGIQDPNETSKLNPGVDLWDEVLNALSDGQPVSVTLVNGDVACGTLAEYTEKYLRIDQKEEDGEDDGVAIVFRADIAYIEYDQKIPCAGSEASDPS